MADATGAPAAAAKLSPQQLQNDVDLKDQQAGADTFEEVPLTASTGDRAQGSQRSDSEGGGTSSKHDDEATPSIGKGEDTANIATPPANEEKKPQGPSLTRASSAGKQQGEAEGVCVGGQSRLERAYVTAKAEKRLVFSTYIPAGFPSNEHFVDLLISLGKWGVDVIEIGVPYSGAYADAALTRQIMDEALRQGVGLESISSQVFEARKGGLSIPVVLVAYWHSLILFGVDAAVSTARRVGIDAFCIIDLPLSEAVSPLPSFVMANPPPAEARPSFVTLCKEAGLSFIPTITIRSPRRTLVAALEVASSFLHLALTDSPASPPVDTDTWRTKLVGAIPRQLERLRKIRLDSSDSMKTALPWVVACGGIASPSQVEQLATVDGFLIGTSLLQRLKHKLGHTKSLHNKVASFLSKPYWEFTKKKPEALESLHSYCTRMREAATAAAIATPSATPPRDDETTPGQADTAAAAAEEEEKYCPPVFYGDWGGCFYPEYIFRALNKVAVAFREAEADPSFWTELTRLQRVYGGRPTPVYEAKRLSALLKVSVFLKREDLCHTGSFKINSALGQVLLAQRLGKTRILCDSGAGQHGVAIASVCAFLKMECTCYMGQVDVQRQQLNVLKMRLLGAKVITVTTGAKTLAAASAEAFKEWLNSMDTTHYARGSVSGSDPYPHMVARFQSVIGEESREQMLKEYGGLPTHVVACVGGGSNAVGAFRAFLNDPDVTLVGVEAGGSMGAPAPGDVATPSAGGGPGGAVGGKKHAFGGIPWKLGRKQSDKPCGLHAATLCTGTPGISRGSLTYLLQDTNTGIASQTSTVSPGLNLPAIGPELVMLKESNKMTCAWVSDEETLAAFELLSREEGIIPALECAHCFAWLTREAPNLSSDKRILIIVSGRGDKDMDVIASRLPAAAAATTTTAPTPDKSAASSAVSNTPITGASASVAASPMSPASGLPEAGVAATTPSNIEAD